MKPKIALDARPLAMPHTGVALEIKQLLESLSSRYRVELLTNKPLIGDFSKFEVVILPGKSRFFWEQLSLLVYLIRKKPKVYIATWNFGIPKLFRGKTKLITIVNDIIPMMLPNTYPMSPIAKYTYNFSLKTSLSMSNKVVCISKSTQKDIKKKFPNINAQVIFITLPSLLKQSEEIKDKEKYFFYIGGLDPRKRVDKLIDGFSIFVKNNPGYRLVLAGKGFDQFDEKIKKLGLKKLVDIPGYITEKDKIKLMSKCTALVFPSIKEGYGLPVAEAIIFGSPVITGDDLALREVAGEAAIYTDVGDEQAIARALKVVTGKKAIERLERARKERKKYLTSDKMSEEYTTLINSIIG